MHYVITEQSSESIVLIKYNTDTKYKLNEFVKTFIDCHKNNDKTSKLFSTINTEGTECYSIINNIPNIKIGEKKLIDLIKDDLIKLLK